MSRDHRDDGNPAAGCGLALAMSLLVFTVIVLLVQIARWVL